MSSLRLQQLRYFLSAVGHKTLSAAAEVEHIARSNLAEQIRRLEHILGGRLFTSTNRELQWTLDPMAEVEFQNHAVELAAQGIGDLRNPQVSTVTTAKPGGSSTLRLKLRSRI